jgi:hypothetical protein
MWLLWALAIVPMKPRRITASKEIIRRRDVFSFYVFNVNKYKNNYLRSGFIWV